MFKVKFYFTYKLKLYTFQMGLAMLDILILLILLSVFNRNTSFVNTRFLAN